MTGPASEDHDLAVAALPDLLAEEAGIVQGEGAHLRLQCACGWHQTYGAVTTLEAMSAAALVHHAQAGATVRIVPPPRAGT